MSTSNAIKDLQEAIDRAGIAGYAGVIKGQKDLACVTLTNGNPDEVYLTVEDLECILEKQRELQVNLDGLERNGV